MRVFMMFSVMLMLIMLFLAGISAVSGLMMKAETMHEKALVKIHDARR